MATTSLKEKRYSRLLRNLFPKGWAWANKKNKVSNLYKLLTSVSLEFSRVDDRAKKLLDELDPNLTAEMLEDWESLLGLPDECSPDEELTIQERRSRIIQILTTRGGQNEAFYKQLASNFGFDIDVISVQDQPPFVAGSRAGDRLTNGPWKYTFIVKAPADVVIRFRAGQSRAGDRLLEVKNETLQCLMQKHKPAHSIVIFSFGNI